MVSMANLRARVSVPIKRVAVIGAGWAGCAAAVRLAERGTQVTLIEASRTLGGRARSVELRDRTIDNGQHILLGAYRRTLGMLCQVGVDPRVALLRLPLQMRYPTGTGMTLVAPRLPAPMHILLGLLHATGLQRADKLALLRFSSAARWMGWHLNTDCSVTELLQRFDQTERLVQLMWRPLCIAALNTPPERASAQIFLNVLQDSLGARRASSDMLLPRCDLSALFPQHAAQYVCEQGGVIKIGNRVRQIDRVGGRWRLGYRTQDSDVGATAEDQVDQDTFDQIIIATDVRSAAAILAPHTDTEVLAKFRYEPITTCYLQYASDCRLPEVFYALVDQQSLQQPGQFVFDRGQLDPNSAGLLAVVISASCGIVDIEHAALVDAIANQLATAFDRADLRTPKWGKVISEKRATFSCTPGLVRPSNTTALAGVILAGDYTESRYPATLEAAVMSGINAADLAISAA